MNDATEPGSLRRYVVPTVFVAIAVMSSFNFGKLIPGPIVSVLGRAPFSMCRKFAAWPSDGSGSTGIATR